MVVKHVNASDVLSRCVPTVVNTGTECPIEDVIHVTVIRVRMLVNSVNFVASEGYVFTGVCHSVNSVGGGGCALLARPPGEVCPPGKADSQEGRPPRKVDPQEGRPPRKQRYHK